MILTDNRTIESYNVDEKKFIVVMITKKDKPTSSGGDTTAAASTASTVSTNEPNTPMSVSDTKVPSKAGNDGLLKTSDATTTAESASAVEIGARTAAETSQ